MGVPFVLQTTLANSKPSSEAAYPAGLGRRLGAGLYDGLLIVALWMGTLFIGVLINSGEAISGAGVQMLLLAELLVFYIYFWSRDGQTLGMTAWRIKVVDETGRPPSFRQLIIRLISALLSWISLGIGYLWFYVGKRQQTWHDQLSKTLVVHIPKSHRR